MHKLIQRSLQDFCRNTNCIIVTREGRKREQIHSTHAFPPFFPLFQQSFHGEYLARSLEHIFAKIYPHCDPLLLFHDRISRPAPTSFPIRADSSAFPTRCRFFPSGSRIVDFGIEFTSSIAARLPFQPFRRSMTGIFHRSRKQPRNPSCLYDRQGHYHYLRPFFPWERDFPIHSDSRPEWAVDHPSNE